MAKKYIGLSFYEEAHKELNYPYIYWSSSLVLIFLVIGILGTIPTPKLFSEITPILNWASIFLIVVSIYYFIISIPLALSMLPLILLIGTISHYAQNNYENFTIYAIGLSITCLSGIYIGRIQKGGIWATIFDIQFIMIAPIWLISNLYKRFRMTSQYLKD